MVIGSIENFEGTIILSDGTELVGLISYNDKTGVLRYENGKNSKSLTAKSVLAFEVFDASIEETRYFYSLQKESSENGAPSSTFFEVIHDFKTFAVLSQTDLLGVKDKSDFKMLSNFSSNGQGVVIGSDVITLQQTETIYLLKPKGNPEAYFSVTTEVMDKKPLFSDGQKTKERFKNKDLLLQYVGADAFEKLEKYADEHKLSFKQKKDFLQILEYYISLTE